MRLQTVVAAILLLATVPVAAANPAPAAAADHLPAAGDADPAAAPTLDVAAAASAAAGDAASRTASALSTIADGAVAAVKAVAAAAVATIQFIVGALAAVARGIGAAASAVASGVAAAARAVGAGIVAVASGIGSAIAFVGALVAASATALWGLLVDGFLLAREHPRESMIVAGSASGAAGAAWLARAAKRLGWLAALPLYSRLKPSELLDNDARAGVYDYIRKNPGASPTVIAESLGLGWGTTIYHLQRLQEASLVAAKRSGNAKCFFATGGPHSPAAQQALSALRHEKALEVARFVSVHPATTQKDIGRALGMSAALVSWHVKRLAASGVLRVERVGKSSSITLGDDVPLAEAQAAAQPAATAVPA